jgi:D-serine deaminase-like pyridoxal phosphate-dependent protein
MALARGSDLLNTAGVHATALPTPQILLDERRLTANIARIQAMAAAGGKRLRPHAKTHKMPWIAHRQLAAGACGICCAKIAEAETFAAAGVDDIRLPYPVQPSNAPRLLALLGSARLSIIVDHADVARGWSAAVSAAGRELDVLVKVDVGFHRCGVDPASACAMALIRQVASAPGLRFRGLLSHAGHAYHARSEADLTRIAHDEAAALRGLADAAARDGIAVSEVSVGATPTVRYSAALDSITELRPGNYVYFDRTQVGLGAARLSDCALTVLARVVSRPAADRIILDAGSKTLTSDGARGFGSATGHGVVLADIESDVPDDALLVERLSEEHATVRVTSGTTHLEPGDLVRIVPNHSCVVSILVDEIRLVDGLQVLDTVRVAARGKIT